MASFNQCVLAGNITKDIELRHIPSGTAVCDISIAMNDKVKKNDEWIEETTFVDLTLWGRTAEVAAEYLSKGSNILVSGRLKQEVWEKDGEKRYKMKVIVDSMQMLGSKNNQAPDDESTNTKPVKKQVKKSEPEKSGIPF